MKQHAFQILLALSSGDLHANGIVTRVRDETDDEVRLWPVTLHRTLDRLCSSGLIIDLDAEGEHPEGASRRRRYYRLTADGAAALADEAERLRGLAAAARNRLGEKRWRQR